MLLYQVGKRALKSDDVNKDMSKWALVHSANRDLNHPSGEQFDRKAFCLVVLDSANFSCKREIAHFQADIFEKVYLNEFCDSRKSSLNGQLFFSSVSTSVLWKVMQILRVI